MVKIRRFNPNQDLLDIAQMANVALGENYKLTMFVNVHEAWPDGFLIAETMGSYNGTIIGILTGQDIARILVLVVAESDRRTGIATKLLDSFIQKSVLRGVKRLTLEVRMSNRSAIRLYEKNNFKIVSTIPAYYSDGEGAFVMERVIS